MFAPGMGRSGALLRAFRCPVAGVQVPQCGLPSAGVQVFRCSGLFSRSRQENSESLSREMVLLAGRNRTSDLGWRGRAS